jgi:hypothetical protein
VESELRERRARENKAGNHAHAPATAQSTGHPDVGSLPPRGGTR